MTIVPSRQCLIEIGRLAEQAPVIDGEVVIAPRPSHKELARRAGTSGELVTRVVCALVNDGILEGRRHAWIVRDVDRLFALARQEWLERAVRPRSRGSDLDQVVLALGGLARLDPDTETVVVQPVPTSREIARRAWTTRVRASQVIEWLIDEGALDVAGDRWTLLDTRHWVPCYRIWQTERSTESLTAHVVVPVGRLSLQVDRGAWQQWPVAHKGPDASTRADP